MRNTRYRMQAGACGVLQDTSSGATATLVTCVQCGHVSTREEYFTEISLGFPPEEKSGSREKRRIEGQVTKLASCLKCFVRETDLPDCCCEACGRLGPDRQVQVSRLPEILCFHVQLLVLTSAKHKKSHDLLNPLVWSLHAASLHCKQ